MALLSCVTRYPFAHSGRNGKRVTGNESPVKSRVSKYPLMSRHIFRTRRDGRRYSSSRVSDLTTTAISIPGLSCPAIPMNQACGPPDPSAVPFLPDTIEAIDLCRGPGASRHPPSVIIVRTAAATAMRSFGQTVRVRSAR